MSTTDIWFSAFLKAKGYEIIKFDVLSRGKGRYYFQISEEDWKKMKVEFNASELLKYKYLIESLKDLVF